MTFAFFILLIATRSPLLGFLSIICIALIVSSVVTIMVLKGWELGIGESIGVVIAIGLSVDYVVHLAAEYIHSKKVDRVEKLQQSYRAMGISIVSGTVTTMGSAVFLFGGQFILYQKFAVIITTTIAFSFMTSMLFFGAMADTIGPQGLLMYEWLFY